MIRLYRILPFLVLLAIVIGVAYLIMSFRYTSERAKALLARFLTWLFSILSGILALITAYALFEQNQPVIELFGSCLVITLIGLAVTRICYAVFKGKHPNYADKAAKATVVNDSMATRFTSAFRKAIGQALRDTFKR